MAAETPTVLICNFLDKAIASLTNQAGGTEADIVSLRTEIEIFLAKVEKIRDEQFGSGSEDELLSRAVAAAQRVEVVVGEYLLRVARRRSQRGTIGSLIQKFKFGDGMASEIRDVVAELQRITYICQKFSDNGRICSREGSRLSTFFSRSSDIEDHSDMVYEVGLVGADSQREELESLVVGKLPKRLIISLFGVAGVGKTALASVVYQKKEVKQHFDHRAWITVTQSYDLDGLIRRMIAQLGRGGGLIVRETDTVQELIFCLSQYLLMKRYVVVFDDVWQTEFLEVMKSVLPNNDAGSRIIITTSNNTTASSCKIVKRLQPLSEENAFTMFYKRAFFFRFGRHHCPEDLLELSRAIVRRCHGLPRVIKAVADHLSSRMEPWDVESEWKTLLNDICHYEFEENLFLNELASTVFTRSFIALPSNIRLCLLYFAMFPEDCSIPEEKLVKLWIAEGFVEEEIGKTLEDVAITYLDDLINRNLVQVEDINDYGIKRIIKVHVLIHGIIKSRAKTAKMGQVLGGKTCSFNDQVRRLALCGDSENIVDLGNRFAKVRSFLNSNGKERMWRNYFGAKFFERFMLLEVLDFEGSPLEDLPNEVGNLVLLKYLSLRNTKVKKLPKSVGLLLNLQTLDVRDTEIQELPIQIHKLQRLRHLLAKKCSSGEVSGVRIKEGIACLESLHTLITVEAQGSGSGIIEELEKLRQLRCLSISKLTADMFNILCSSIEHMKDLQSLSLYSTNTQDTFNLKLISSPPLFLRHLVLKCKLRKLPGWISRLKNLHSLELSFSRLASDPLKTLQSLPNLVYLLLRRAYSGEELHFEEGSFSKLKKLILAELNGLRKMEIERGSLPLLEELKIRQIQLLKEVPPGIQHLKNLKDLEFYGMSREFELNMKRDGGSDSWKVRHVLHVHCRPSITNVPRDVNARMTLDKDRFMRTR